MTDYCTTATAPATGDNYPDLPDFLRRDQPTPFPNLGARLRVAKTDELANHADAIRRIGKRVVEDVIEIGRRLVECRDHPSMKHGMWTEWLKDEFGWEKSTAENFIHVFEASAKNGKFPRLNVPLSGLYLLAAPSTPDQAHEEVIERSEAGEKLTVAKVAEVIADHKQVTNPANPADKSRGKAKPQEAAEPTPWGKNKNLRGSESLERPGRSNDNFEDDTFEPDETVEEPKTVLVNVLDSIKQAKAVAEAYRKIFKVSSFDRTAKKQTSNEIELLIRKWRSVQSTLAAVVEPQTVEGGAS